jgi:16S rRNA (cytidine1402-2'-O)-methyltransferase
MKSGNLYLIPNFIGDTPSTQQFPAYNHEIVKGLKYFFVENPKPARALIKALHKEVDFNEIELFQFDKHAKDNSETYREVLNCLQAGNSVGVLSDAGCPGIADPGSELVRWAHEKNIQVIPLIGPSSIFLTLMSSGLNGQNFSFIGYLSKDAKERADQIKKMAINTKSSQLTYLFIETPYKTDATLKDLLQHLSPSNYLCLGVDLFSMQQNITTYSVDQWRKVKSLPALKDRQVVFAVG